MFGIIYKITSPSGKVYIGKTSRDFAVRKREHYHTANRLTNSNQFFSLTKVNKSIRKYGTSLKWEILYEDVPEIYLGYMEQWTIQIYDTFYNGYNSTLGGEGLIGAEFSEEHKRKLSVNAKKRTFSLETRQKMSDSGRGRKHSKEHNKKVSDAKKGKKVSPERLAKMIGRPVSEATRAKLSATKKGTKASEQARLKMSIAQKARGPRSVETRAKISENNRKRVYSLETKLKIAEGLKRYHQLRKQNG